MTSPLIDIQPQTRPIGRAKWPAVLAAYVFVHGVWLLLYALLGKGFAYAGYPPLYAGECLLIFGLVALFVSGRLSAMTKTPLGLAIIAFIVWQFCCAVPYLEAYGTDTLRDSVIWGYALFAWVTAALVLRLPGLMRVVVAQFIRFSRLFLIVGPIVWLATTHVPTALPHWSDTSVSIPSIKGDEYSVHLAGIFALAMQGVTLDHWFWISLLLIDATLGMAVRGGLLAFVTAAGFAILLRPRLYRSIFILGVAMLLASAMATFDLRVVVPTTGRELSLEQFELGLASVIGTSEHPDLEGTKRWRLLWWREIGEYTINGQYFWMGKGYGINLADSDGFQVGSRDEPLRSPHNSHLTFLARSGVPGFVLWVALQFTWFASMLKSYFYARRLHASQWQAVFAWLIAYWLAFTVAAAFDVFLEGPMAGIPFWTIFGLGWGGHTLFQSQLTSGSNLRLKRTGAAGSRSLQESLA